MSSLLRLSSRSLRFFSKSKFYHPTAYSFDVDHHQSESYKLQYYINLYRKYGHHYASLDPLKIHQKYIIYYGSTEYFAKPVDLQIKNQDSLSSLDPRQSYISGQCQNVKELEYKLNKVYKSSCGVEFEHVPNAQEQTWLYNKFEEAMLSEVFIDKKREMAQLLIQTEALDHFLHKKFVTFKRYSGEGAESAVVALKTVFEYAAYKDIENIVMGIPHRGRLNVLVNLLDYPAADLFRKISGKTDTPSDLVSAIDDVTSHIAQSVQKTYSTPAGEKKTYISTLHNPSHLYAQNAVSMGKTRSKQHHTKKDVLNIQVHGDAAFSAQGIVFESLCLSKVPYYSIGGTVHMIVNNQIGYTTKPIHARPSKYCSDVVKGFGIPVIHVNAESIEDVYRVMRLALDYRQQFHKDILVDLICYRRYGHNEVDEPEFTQPRMYNQIRKHQSTYPKAYFYTVKKDGLLEANTYEDIRKKAFENWEKDFNTSKTVEKVLLRDYASEDRPGQKTNTSSWKNFKPSFLGTEQDTNVQYSLLRQYAKASTFYPPDFAIHQRIQRFHVEDRLKSIYKNELNWATCYALALFSLVAEGYNVRMTGQDVYRGTFSQRHINLTDQKTETEFNALQFFSEQGPGRGNVEIYNSPLSYNGVMSYEYGYSIDNPNNLSIWYAQFGDFFNPAQVVIDTYITNGYAKWLRQSGLVLLLPHGYDGAGPEHSSCRIERFLLLANTDGVNRRYKYKPHDPNRQPLKIGEEIFYYNIQEANFSFAYPTTPANYFHLLRRQMKRNFRKPLVVAGPKTLLRHPKCISKFSDMSYTTGFQRMLHYTPEYSLNSCRNLIICSGKYVYDIINLIESSKITDASVVTIEELFPFPYQELKYVIQQVPYNAQILWVQYENMNSGAYLFAYPHISRILEECNKEPLKYIGRRALAMTAVGSSELHSRYAKELTEYLASLIK